MEKETKFFLINNVIWVVALVAMTYAINLQYKEIYSEAIESYKMVHNITLKDNNFGIDGIYYQQGYYCIWTKDKTAKEIFNTECHEQYHALIDKDYEHFCNETNN